MIKTRSTGGTDAGTSVKYWYEKAAVSEQIPKWLDVPFLGWNENQTAKEGQYQPGENLPAEKIRI
mgnify:FL=1